MQNEFVCTNGDVQCEVVEQTENDLVCELEIVEAGVP